MQYKMYSFDEEYLPHIPHNLNNESSSTVTVSERYRDTELEGCNMKLFTDRDMNSFTKEFQLNIDTKKLSTATLQQLPIQIGAVFKDIEEIEIISDFQRQVRMSLQSGEPNYRRKKMTYEQIISQQLAMMILCNKDVGFIIWLNAGSKLHDYRNIIAMPLPITDNMRRLSAEISNYATKVLKDMPHRIKEKAEGQGEEQFTYDNNALTKAEVIYLQGLIYCTCLLFFLL